MSLKLDHSFYVNWLSESNVMLPLREGLYYAVGVHPDSMGSTLPDVKIKVERLECTIRAARVMEDHDDSVKEYFENILKGNEIISRRHFSSLMYQYISDFPQELFSAYKQAVGVPLKLENSSPIRRVYDEYAKFDLWTLRVACSLVSHMHPKSAALDVIAGRIACGNKELIQRVLYLPHACTSLFPNIDLYEYNYQLVLAAIKASRLKCFEEDVGGIRRKSVIPANFLDWANSKKITFHPTLEELVRDYTPQNAAPRMLSKEQKLRLDQEDKQKTQECAKKIWEKEPNKTIASMCKNEEVLSFCRQYKEKTHRKWVSEVAPPTVKGKRGRPRKNATQETLQEDNFNL